MILGLLSLAAMAYGIGTVFKGSFVKPVADIVESAFDAYADTVTDITSKMYRPGEGVPDENHETIFIEHAVLRHAATYHPDLLHWLSKSICFTDSEFEDFNELVIPLQYFDLHIANTVENKEVLRGQRWVLVSPILTFLDSFHPDRVKKL